MVNTNKTNFIGDLNDYCQRKRISDPVYVNVDRRGPPHSPIFVYQCYIQDRTFVGEGSTKKIAKENSAKSAMMALGAPDTGEVYFKIVQVGSDEQTLKSLWKGSIENLEIIVERKNGEQQEFKIFYLTSRNPLL